MISIFFRDEKGYEVDTILTLHDGRWAAIEIKLENYNLDKAAANLLKIEEKIISIND